MGFQNVININQAFGKSGTYADDSARRDKVYALYGAEGIGSAANGKIVFANNLTNGDTITIGETVLTAVTASAGVDQFVVGANLAETLANIAALTVDGVVISANATTLFVIAEETGEAGNDIKLATSVATAIVTAMAGGADVEQINPVLARFYTSIEPGKARMGGTGGIQVGVAMNNGNVALKGGLDASLAVEQGSPVDVCSFGHIFIESATEIVVGYGACYDTSTGIISAYNKTGSVPTGNVAIEGAEFIYVNGEANTVGILSLNGK